MTTILGCSTKTQNLLENLIGNMEIQTTGGDNQDTGQTCVILNSNTVKCWGVGKAPPSISGGPQLSGQAKAAYDKLYLGQTAIGNGELADSVVAVPTNVIDLNNVKFVTTGFAHACALLNDGTLKCWGNNLEGQLGQGLFPYLEATKPISVPGLTNVESVAAGASHTCALLQDGSVQCWGNNTSGQLGNPNVSDAMSFKPIDVSLSEKAIQIVATEYSSCALLESGKVQCWGNNFFGQLGNKEKPGKSPSPTNVFGVSNAASISLGSTSACALTTDKTVKCWGDGGAGQLGNGKNGYAYSADSYKDGAVDVLNLNNVDSITSGYKHNCALLKSGKVNCWGGNLGGQLGNGTKTFSSIPVEVSNLSGVFAITAGGLHTCAIAQSSIQCWGYGLGGQLGNGKAINSLAPTPTAINLLEELN